MAISVQNHVSNLLPFTVNDSPLAGLNLETSVGSYYDHHRHWVPVTGIFITLVKATNNVKITVEVN